MGADDSGDDLVVGEHNEAEDGTHLVATVNDDGTYGDDYVFQASVTPLVGHTVDGLRGISRGLGNGVFGTTGSGGAGVLGRVDGTAGAGVRGENLTGAAVLGVSAPTDPAQPLGVGVRGLAQDPANKGLQGVGVEGRSQNGIGVRGISDGTETGAVGVLGIADAIADIGVGGTSNDGIGVRGRSTNGTGVDAHSDTDDALVATSVRGRGGVFQSGKGAKAPIGLASAGGIAQARLVPSVDGVLPVAGKLGDLYAIVSNVATREHGGVLLFLCVQEGTPPMWQRVQLDPTPQPGGTAIP